MVTNKQQNRISTTHQLGTVNFSLLFEYEQQIIIMLLGDEEDTKRGYILSHLDTKMFVHRFYGIVFEIIKSLYELKQPISVFTVMEYLESNQEREDVKLLYSKFTSALNCKFFLEKIINAYIDRLTEKAKTYDELDEVERERVKYSLKPSMMPLTDIMKALPSEIQSTKNKVIMPFPSISKHISCLMGGDVMVLAGGTGMGKTCMALNLIERIQATHKVSVYSLEMSGFQLATRIASSKLNIPCQKFRDNSLTPRENIEFSKFISTFKSNLNICDIKRIGVNFIRQNEKRLDSELIVIDYLGLLTPETRGKKYEVITEMSRDIKVMAMELNKPVILLHQINRDYMSRDDKEPQLSDLRDSGAIEQDADMVCFVHRPYVVGDAVTDDHIKFIIRKNRFGTPNVGVSMIFDGEHQKIHDEIEVMNELGRM